MRTPSARRVPIHAVAATERGRRRNWRPTAGCAKRVIAPEPGQPEVSPGAPAPRACRLARRRPAEVAARRRSRFHGTPGAAPPSARRAPGSNRPAPLRHGRAGWRRHPGKERCATRRPARANHGCGAFRAPHPRPHAGGHGDGTMGGGRGTGRRHQARETRYCTQPGHREVIALRTCATGVQAARRHPGEVAARRRSWTRAARSTLCHRTHAHGGYPPAQLRHGRAGCASASR